jgi:hypothetical protein
MHLSISIFSDSTRFSSQIRGVGIRSYANSNHDSRISSIISRYKKIASLCFRFFFHSCRIMCRQVFEVSGNDFINENGRDSHMGGCTRLNYGTSVGRVQSSRLYVLYSRVDKSR